MKIRSFTMASIISLLMLVGCTESGGDRTQRTPVPKEEPPAEKPAPEVTEWEKDGLKVYALPDSPKFPDAKLGLNGLEDGSKQASGSVKFDFTVEGYELGAQTSDAGQNGLANSAKGQHIHLILNNGPYSAHYEPGFDKEMEDGHYVMLAFLSRSYHESVKPSGAAVIRQFTVGEGEHEAADLSGQHMFYSRPKGVYKGDDIKKLMLDFYLLNTTISPDGNKVRATINGVEFVFTKWVPYVIEGLSAGEVEIKLELIDKDGAAVPGPFNTVTRTVTLEE